METAYLIDHRNRFTISRYIISSCKLTNYMENYKGPTLCLEEKERSYRRQVYLVLAYRSELLRV